MDLVASWIPSWMAVAERLVGSTAYPACADPRRQDVRRGSRFSRVVIAGGMAMAAAACTPVPVSVSPASYSASAVTRVDCPVADFSVFIERFSQDIEFQKQTTAHPLEVERYDTEAEPEPRRIAAEIASGDVAWPVMPRLDHLRAQGRSVEVESSVDGRAEVKVRRPDTSDQQIYVFAQSPCWQLHRVIDDSI